MKINGSKCKIMLFNRSRKYDFMPNVKFSENQSGEVVEEMKLLGVHFSSDLKWHSHIKHIAKSANTKLWVIRRLKKLGAENSILIDLYNKQIRSTLEYACPVWAPGLTQSDIKELERVQKSAFAIIFGYQDYKHTLQKHNLKTLEER